MAEVDYKSWQHGVRRGRNLRNVGIEIQPLPSDLPEPETAEAEAPQATAEEQTKAGD